MKTLVTGGTGFIGGALVRHLVRRGAQVRVLVRQESDRRMLAGLPVEVVSGDLLDEASLSQAVKGCRRLYHVAALYSLWVPRPDLIYRVNVEGTRNILRVALAEGVEKVVYTSTVGVVGIPEEGGPGHEGIPLSFDEIRGHYKRSKYLAEQEALQMAHRGLPVVIVNPSAPVGPGDVKPTPTGRMIVDFLNGKMWGYIETGLNLIDVEDVAEGHVLAAEKGKVGERYILGNKNVTLREIFDALERISGVRAPRMKVPYPVVLSLAFVNQWVSDHITHAPPQIPLEGVRMAQKYMFFDPSKAIRELGLPQTPVEVALQKAVRWFRENGYVKNENP